MRDGDPPRVRHLPARRATASSSRAASRRSCCITPYDKTERRYTRDRRLLRPAAATTSCCRTCATATAPRGRSEYFHARHAAHRRGRLRHDRVDRRAAVVERPHRHGRQLVRGDHPGAHRARGAAAPDRDLARRRRRRTAYHNQTREGGAMQLHMFWALYIHAADAQEVQGDPDKQEDVWNDLRNLRQLFWGWPVAARASSRCGTCRRSTRRSSDYDTRGAYDEWWARKENDYTRFWDRARRHPGRRCRPAGTTASRTPTPSTSRRWRRRTRAPQRLVVGPWSHVGMRGDATYTPRRRLRRRRRAGACSATSTSSSTFFDRWLPDDATGPAGRTRRRCGSS